MFYIIEIQKYDDGSFGHLVHWADDTNKDKARMKGESKYYEVLAAAAISELPQHSVTLLNDEGVAIMNKCYTHGYVAPNFPEVVFVPTPEEPENETPEGESEGGAE